MLSLRRTILTAATLVAAACSSSTEPGVLTVDPTLDLGSAHARWLATRPSSYTVEIRTATAMVPSIGFVRVRVVGDSVVEARVADSGAPVATPSVTTIDRVWSDLLAARTAGESLTDLRFSREGIPIRAMRGTFANDGGVAYTIRAFVAQGAPAR